MYGIKLSDPTKADEMVGYLETNFPEIDVRLTSEFAENLPDMQSSEQMMSQISFLAVLIGGVGMLNTLLMSVLERTREIGVLRALGWRRRQVVDMILKEATALGIVGGVFGTLLGMVLAWSLTRIPIIGGMLDPQYDLQLILLAMSVAIITGLLGGLYPAWRATRMQPVEALRYE
jgi:putative ABC transport system permease protein